MIGKVHEISWEEHDLIDPMQLTLAVLQEAIEPLIWLISDEGESGLNLALLQSLYDQMQKHFSTIDKKEKPRQL